MRPEEPVRRMRTGVEGRGKRAVGQACRLNSVLHQRPNRGAAADVILMERQRLKDLRGRIGAFYCRLDPSEYRRMTAWALRMRA